MAHLHSLHSFLLALVMQFHELSIHFANAIQFNLPVRTLSPGILPPISGFSSQAGYQLWEQVDLAQLASKVFYNRCYFFSVFISVCSYCLEILLEIVILRDC